jgi:hypothetical protein
VPAVPLPPAAASARRTTWHGHATARLVVRRPSSLIPLPRTCLCLAFRRRARPVRVQMPLVPDRGGPTARELIAIRTMID